MLIRHVIYFEKSSCYGNEKRQNVSLVGDYLYFVGNACVLTSFNQPKKHAEIQKLDEYFRK